MIHRGKQIDKPTYQLRQVFFLTNVPVQKLFWVFLSPTQTHCLVATFATFMHLQCLPV